MRCLALFYSRCRRVSNSYGTFRLPRKSLCSKNTLTIAACLYPAGLVLLGTATSLWQLVGVLLCFSGCGNLSNISAGHAGVGVERMCMIQYHAGFFHGVRLSLAGFTGGIISTLMVLIVSRLSLDFCIVYATGFFIDAGGQEICFTGDAGADSKKKKENIW